MALMSPCGYPFVIALISDFYLIVNPLAVCRVLTFAVCSDNCPLGSDCAYMALSL